jgi:hypothetical protein
LIAAKVKTKATSGLELFHYDIKKADCLIQHNNFVFLNRLPAEPLFYRNKIIDILSIS